MANNAILDFLDKQGASDKPARASDKACPKCGSYEAWGEASWCPACGYYPSLHGPVTADEAATANTEANATATPEIAAADEPVKPIKATDVGAMAAMLPAWSWFALGGVVLILVANILAKLVVLTESSQMRSVGAVAEILVAGLILFVTHLASYLYAIGKSDRVSPGDFFLKPFEVWKYTLQALPATANRVCLLIWSVSAILCAVLILGGLTFDGLFDDWGVRRAAKGNLVQAIVREAREEQAGDESLQGAMNQFVGDGKNPAEEQREETDCVVIGYTERPDGSYGSLLLAAAPKGRLSYVGMLDMALFEDEVRAEAIERLEDLRKRDKPLARKVPVAGVWVEPTLLVRVSFTNWTAGYTLVKPELVEILRASRRVR